MPSLPASPRSTTRGPWRSSPSTKRAAKCSASAPSCGCRLRRGEYAVLVRSDLKSRGLGWLLMQMIVDYARAEGIRVIEGQVLRENTTMLNMCRELGFEIASDPEEADVQW